MDECDSISSSNKQSRAAVVAACLERFTDDEDMQAIFCSIEYSNFKYDRETFANSKQEKQLDKLLMNSSAAALAWKANLLKNEDLHPLQYLVRRTVRDFGVAEYWKFVSSWASRAELGEHPYDAL